MVEKIEIENFKSIKKLSLDLGRINVIIGANGTGKTNILEAIAIGCAASSDKLDYEFLSTRLRLTDEDFLINAFNEIEGEKRNSTIEVSFKSHGNENFVNYKIKSNNSKGKLVSNINDNQILMLDEFIDHDLKEFFEIIDSDSKNSNELFKKIEDYKLRQKELKEKANLIINSVNFNYLISDFLIYTPEYSFLNKFEEQGQILPLGVKGEGLFSALKKILTDETKQEQLKEIKENLEILDWFEDFNIPKDNMFNEHKIAIKDKFLDANKFFDQKSSNEGFLFLLFYLVLFTSENTPNFFAIDNIDTGFNPKLCRELIQILTKLAKKYDKQVIFTTHNPAILDGLDLKDDEQRLLVVKRKRDGSSTVKRIEHKPDTNMKLSELWMSGAIGGLPTNF